MLSVFDLSAQEQYSSLKIIAGLERISQALRFLMWDTGKRYGVTPIQMQCLIFICFHSEEQNRAGVLAKEFDVTPATISQTIRALTQKGYLEKKPSSSDARIHTLHLTEQGKEITAQIDNWANTLTPLVDSLENKKQQDLLSVLFELIAAMQKQGIISAARQCTTCRFFRPSDKNDTYFCKLLEKELELNDLRLDCPEHETAQ